MGKAFLECVCNLRVDSSLIFHKSRLSPTRLHSDPVLVPGASKLASTWYDLTSPSNSCLSYSRWAQDPVRTEGKSVLTFVCGFSSATLLCASLFAVSLLPSVKWKILISFNPLQINTEILLTSLTLPKVSIPGLLSCDNLNEQDFQKLMSEVLKMSPTSNLPVEACVCSAVVVGELSLKSNYKWKELEETLGTN